MKRKLIFSLAATFVAAGFAFGGFESQASSISELSAEAGSYCTQDSSTDCKSSATGNIYPGYRAASYEEVEQ